MEYEKNDMKPACGRESCCCRQKATPREEREQRMLQNRLKKDDRPAGGDKQDAG